MSLIIASLIAVAANAADPSAARTPAPAPAAAVASDPADGYQGYRRHDVVCLRATRRPAAARLGLRIGRETCRRERHWTRDGLTIRAR